jgi:predicted metal-dependent phosphoesterase TrpH
MDTRAKVRPLLCELHAHTTWSDGELSVGQLVDLYGRHGFDVLCVTDHILPAGDPWRRARERQGHPVCITEKTWPAYVRDVEREARRADARYGMLVIPGAELTLNHDDADLAAHAVAIGLRRTFE